MKKCSVNGCRRKFVAKEFCKFHYQRNRLGSKVLGPIKRRPLGVDEEFWFWTRVLKTESCWMWLGAKNNTGYGTTFWRKKAITAHRLSFRLVNGEIPPNLELDHLCKIRSCVNPNHLEPVTHRENVLRGVSPSAFHAKKTHCPKGHPFHGENLKIRIKNNGTKIRQCRTCHGWGGLSKQQ